MYKNLTSPVINILGNHDLQALSKSEYFDLFNSIQVQPDFYGIKVINNIQIAWLDVEFDNEGLAILPENNFELLKEKIDNNLPLILFSHYSLVEQNDRGNFYFENDSKKLQYKNFEKINSILKEKNLLLSIGAHAHWIGLNFVNNNIYLTAPSFSEHLFTSESPDLCPCVYSELEIVDEKLVFKSFSGEFCFFNTEIEIKNKH